MDDEIVVIHDKHTGRVGNKKLFVNKSKLDELKSVYIGIKKSYAFKGKRIPTLREVLETVPLESKLIIEVKCGKEVIDPLVELLGSTKLKNNQIEIISFKLEVLSLIKKEIPHYKALWLFDLDYYLPHWLLKVNPNKIIKKVKNGGLDGVNVWAGKVIERSFV